MKGPIVHVEGMEFLREQLEGFLPRESIAILRRTTVRIAASVRDGIRERAPVLTKTLRKAIVSKRDRGTRDSVEASVLITKGKQAKHDAFYWHMVEFGTQHSAPQPFITPVVEQARSTYREDIARELNTQVLKQLEQRAKRQRARR